MKTKEIKRLVFSGALLALGMVLPFLTAQMKEIGDSLLPMHLPVLLCGFLISDFGIVCEADDDLLGVANEIKGEILDRSGSELEVSDAQRIGLRDIVLRLEASDGYVGENGRGGD